MSSRPSRDPETGLYPVALRLRDRPVLVVGGGRVAERRVSRLLEAGARVTVVSPRLRPALVRAARAGRLDWVTRTYRPEDLDGRALVLIATGDTGLARRVTAEAERRGILCNAAEDAGLGDFHLPAVGDLGPVRIAVSSGGADPALAARWRDQLIERARNAAPAGDDADGSGDAFRPGTVALVGAGPGDPGLLTARALARLRDADVVYHDRLVGPAVLARVPEGTETVYVGKEVGRATRANIARLLVESARAGRRVVRLKGGDPMLFARGGEEMRALREARVEFEVVPGVSALASVPAGAGIPLTYRRIASEVVVRSGHALAGEATSGEREHRPTTWVYFMAVGRLERVVDELLEEGVSPETPAAVIASGTLPGQRVVEAELHSVAEAAREEAVEAPALVVVGDVVSFRDPATFAALLDEVAGRSEAAAGSVPPPPAGDPGTRIDRGREGRRPPPVTTAHTQRREEAG